jgi:hypothetical protein
VIRPIGRWYIRAAGAGLAPTSSIRYPNLQSKESLGAARATRARPNVA